MYSSLEINNDAFTDFYLLFCGMQECTPLYSYGPAIRDNFLIHYCIKGKGTYFVKNQKYKIQQGDAFLILPGEVTFYQADEDDPWTYVWIGFDGLKSTIYLSRCGLDKNHLTTHCDEVSTLTGIIEDIIAHNTLSYSNELYIQGKLFEFFSYFSASANIEYKTELKHENVHVNKAIEFIQKNYQNSFTVNDIANYVGLNRSYFSSIFQKQLHMSPQQFLLKFRITKACEMLSNTDLSINSISYSCGYANQLAFSKAFRKVTRNSPSSYRKEKKIGKNEVRDEDPHKDEKI